LNDHGLGYDRAAMLNRRRFLQRLSAGLLAAPVVAEGQPAGKMRRIGFISVTHRADAEDPFFRRLGELGYVEGQNLITERRYSEGRAERFAEFATELVRLKVDVIVVNTTPAALAVKRSTHTIPIVIPTAIDPVAAGLVASLARPGGNVTGLTSQAPELAGKRLQLLKEAIPRLSRVAVLWNAANPANARPWRETQDAARALGVALQSQEVRGPADFERVFAAMVRAHPDALFFLGDALTIQHTGEVVGFITRSRIPSMFDRAEMTAAGGLMSYGTQFTDLWRRGAVLVDKILKGAQPADLPVEQPTTFELVINLKTAKALGLTVPPSILARADHIIE
jgi:putative ABC transport system substrate-binding protein